jgi:hypothetical protein
VLLCISDLSGIFIYSRSDHPHPSNLLYNHHILGRERAREGEREREREISEFNYEKIERKRKGGTDMVNEKMDMLWEDFNEELFRSPFDPMKEVYGYHKTPRQHYSMESPGLALGQSKSKRSGSKNGKPGLMVMLRVLKKLFFSQRDSKRRAKYQI